MAILKQVLYIFCGSTLFSARSIKFFLTFFYVIKIRQLEPFIPEIFTDSVSSPTICVCKYSTCLIHTGEASSAIIQRFKKRGSRKRGHRHGNSGEDTALYNGEVKTPDEDEDTEQEEEEGGEEKENKEANTKVDNTDEYLLAGDSLNISSENTTTNTAFSPQKHSHAVGGTVASRNPSPGRSRRSGILFKKKKHYQPTKPSPLVLYNSSSTATTTTATSEEDLTMKIISHSAHSPQKQPSLKLRLRIDSSCRARYVFFRVCLTLSRRVTRSAVHKNCPQRTREPLCGPYKYLRIPAFMRA